MASDRHELKQAIAARDAAAEKHRVATEAARRAEQLLREAEARAASFAGLDTAIAEHIATGIRIWSAEGGERPSKVLPPHLEERRLARREAEEEVASARAAAALLAGERDDVVKRELDHAERSVRDAAVDVLCAHAEAVANELIAAHQRVHDLRSRLIGLSGVSGKGRPIELPQIVLSALDQRDPDLSAVPGKRLSERYRALFIDTMAKLIKDPDVDLNRMA